MSWLDVFSYVNLRGPAIASLAAASGLVFVVTAIVEANLGIKDGEIEALRRVRKSSRFLIGFLFHIYIDAYSRQNARAQNS